MQSTRGKLNLADLKQVGKNALIFAGPALLVLLGSFYSIIPQGSAKGAIALYVLNLLTDLLKKFLAGK